ncbi:MAG: hypothetical protein JW945_04705, partial [Methanomicrobia archaeon]|nr:hypothetical protein [Methanomicrobia archaeon]
FTATLTSTSGNLTLTDSALVMIHIHVPVIDYELEELSVDNVTLMKTFRLTNTGDPVTDLSISVADNFTANAYIEPVIEHYRLAAGASLEFHVIPILASPDFQPHSPIPPVLGDITVQGGGVQAKERITFTVPEGKQPYKAVVSSPGVMNVGRVKCHHCNNKPNTKTPFDVHSGVKDKVRDDPLIIRFSAPGWEIRPHDLYVSINGHEVGSLINIIPEGYYKFEVDPAFLIYPEHGVAKNYIELHSVHQNGGHYLVSSDVEVRLNLINYETWVIASSQEEANQIAAANLPPGFYESPDNISIGSVEITAEGSSSAPLGLTSTYPEVYIGKKITMQATAEPNLDVDASFSNGDGSVHLAEVSPGVYQGTWTPRKPGEPSTGLCVITIRAKGSGVQGEKTQTVKILNPTKLILSINEPGDGKKIQQLEGWTEYYYGVQPVRVTVTDDTGSEIKPGDVNILGRAVTTKADNTTFTQSLSSWVDEGSGRFRCDWTPKYPGDYEITVYAQDLTELKRKNAKASVTGTLEEAEIKLTNVKGPSGTIDPYWDYTKPPKEVFSPRIPTPYSASLLYLHCREDFDVSFTLNKKAKVKYEVYSNKPGEWFWGDPDKTTELGTYEKGDHTFSLLNVVAYGDADHSYKIKLIAESVDGEKTDSDESVTFTIKRKPYFKVDKKAQYVNIEEPSVLSLAFFLGKPLIGLFLGDVSATAPIVFHVADLGLSSKPAADYEKIALVERWYIEVYNWDNKQDRYVIHSSPNYEMPQGLTEQQAVLTPYPVSGRMMVESRTYYAEKQEKYYAVMPSECNATWYSYEGVKFFIEGGSWKLAQAGKDLSIYTKVLVTAIQGGIDIADKITVRGAKIVSKFVPTDTEIIIYRPVNGYNPLTERWDYPSWDRVETRALESYEAKFGSRPKPAMNFNSIMNPNQKSHTVHDVPVDDAVEEVTFYINWDANVENKTKRLSIEDPEGAVIDPEAAPSEPAIRHLTYIMSNSDTGETQRVVELYRVKKPLAGTWKMNVTTEGTGTLEYYMGVFADSEIVLLFDMDKTMYAPHETMTLEARLLYGDAPLQNATVIAGIQKPDGSTETLALIDDGNHSDYQANDGIYANTYDNPSIEGAYWFNITASGTTGEDSFVRAASLKRLVQERPVVYIDTPHDGATIGGVVDISISAVDNSNTITSYEISIDGIKVAHTNAYSWNTFAADGTHTIRGQATDDEANTGSAEITVTVANIPDPSDTDPPSAPNGLTVSLVETGTALNLTWTPNSEPDLAGYTIYRSYVSGGPYTKLNGDPILNAAYLDNGIYTTGLNGARIYYYVVSAVDVNQLESIFSDEESGKPFASWLDTYESELYLDAARSQNVAVTDGALTLTGGSTNGYAVSEAIMPDSIQSWNNLYWLESGLAQITGMEISQDGSVWHSVSNGEDISSLDPALPLYYNCSIASDGVNNSALYELLVIYTMNAEPVGFTGVYNDTGTDIDANGLYDYLTIRVGVDIESPGFYYLVGDLEDVTANPLFRKHERLYYLTEGTQLLDLTFPGELMYQHGVNGTYTLTDLVLQDVQFHQIDALAMTYITGAYNYTDFEHPPAQFADSFSDHGQDTDGDGQYDALIITVGLTIESAGDYIITGTLRDTTGREIATASNLSQAAANVSTVNLSLTFSGLHIWRHRVDGPYNLSNLTLVDSTNLVGYREQAYTTGAYTYTEFQKPAVAFRGNFSEYGTDTDTDGKYEYLTIEADVELAIDAAGTYNVTGRLEDGTGKVLALASRTVDLTGDATVNVTFSGPILHGLGIDGPYKLKDLLIYNTEDTSVFDALADAHTTSDYAATDFETAPVDLTLDPTDISFSDDAPELGEQITITATVRNVGTAEAVDVVVQFFDGNPAAGSAQIGADQAIALIASAGTETAQVNWTAVSGTYTIFVRIDPYETIVEANETNNQAYKQIAITGAPLPDLTLGSEDIQLILPAETTPTSSLQSQPLLAPGSLVTGQLSEAEKRSRSGLAPYLSGVMMNGVETINSSWARSPPTIDGTLASGEWNNATAINITFLIEDNCLMFVLNDNENLYLAFDVVSDGTNDVNDQDVVQLGFDGDHDNLIPPYGTYPFYMGWTCVDLVAQIFGDPAFSWAGWLNMNEAGTDCSLRWNSSDPTGPQVLATGFSGHRVYEYRIPLATALNVSPG